MEKLRQSESDWLPYLLLGIFLIVAFLPVSSFLFATKNDALTANFPNKYFFSAALHAGKLPLWNPYVNFGLPLYADPGFAFWHPLTWLFGAIGYNVYMLSIEVLTYIWLGGIFMHRLGRYFGHGQMTCFLMGVIFMCSGFFVGNFSHINFLTAAAFLPLVILNFLQLQKDLSAKRLLFAAASLFLLLSAGHPAIPFATAYFLAVLVAVLLLQIPPPGRTAQRMRILRTNFLLLLSVAGLAAPVLLSWMEIYPHFSRAKPVLQTSETGLGFSFSSFISFLFPFSTTAYTDGFATDVSMRNGYFSFLGLALLIIALINRRNKYQNMFLAGGAVMLVLSLGGPVKAILYSHLPLLRYIRSNGEYRVFAILSFIIVFSYPLDRLLKDRTAPLQLNRLLMAIALACGAIITVTGIYLWRSGPLSITLPGASITTNIKYLLDHLSLSARLLINAFYLLLLLIPWFLLKRRFSPNKILPATLMADMILFCWLHLPVTGVQRKSPSEIAGYFSAIPPRLPLPELTPIASNISKDKDLEKTIGSWSYYSKQPGNPQLCDYPTLLSTTEAYFHSGLPDTVNSHPFLFLKRQLKGSSVSLTIFSPRQIDVRVSAASADTLVLLQNGYPGWKTLINGQSAPLQQEYIAFMGTAVPNGTSIVSFRFENQYPLRYLLIGLAAGMLLSVLSVREKLKKVKQPYHGSLRSDPV